MGPKDAGKGLAGSPRSSLPARVRPLELCPRWPCAGGARLRIQARHYLVPRRVSTPTRRPACSSRGSPGSRSCCCPHCGLAQWNRPRTLSLIARARGPCPLRSLTSAPARVWNYLDCTKRAEAGGERGVALFSHAHSAPQGKGRARTKFPEPGILATGLLPA